MRRTGPALAFLFLSWLVLPPARADGSLRGAVVDARHEPIPGASLRLVRASDGASVETEAGTLGGFKFPSIPDGAWSLEASAAGFETGRFPDLEVRGHALPDRVIVLERAPVEASRPESDAVRRHDERSEIETRSEQASPPPPGADFLPLLDRYRIGFPHWDRSPRAPHTDVPTERGSVWNPYNQNVWKGDYPIAGDQVFLVLTGVLDVLAEARRLPTPSGPSAEGPGSESFFGDGRQLFSPSSLVLSADLFHGTTTFRPPEWRLRVTPVLSVNFLETRERGVVDVDVREGTRRTDGHVALQELFGEARLATVSPHYDFVSIRSGIQPFQSDFRGFLYADNQPGLRVYGSFGNNRNQWNAAAFDLLEKDTNSGLNTLEKRHQQVYLANYYRQDFLTPGYTVTASWNRSHDEAGSKDPDGLHFDDNGFLVRPAPIGDFTPHDLTVDYFGFGGDGHVGRLNLTHMAYLARGHEDHNPIAARRTDVRATFGAVEVSIDRDWQRYKLSALYASGDDDPLDGDATGFDAIVDNANFAGGQTSIWNRQGFRLTQTLTGLVSRFSFLPSLRTSKEEGQANFVNPGLLLLNAGTDLELTPKLTLSGNVNYLRFDKTEVLELLLFQAPIRRTIGFDVGVGFQYRPFLTDNVIVNGGLAVLLPGAGLKDLFVDDTFVSAFTALTLTY